MTFNQAEVINTTTVEGSSVNSVVYTVPAGRYAVLSLTTSDGSNTRINNTGLTLSGITGVPTTLALASGQTIRTSGSFSGNYHITALEFNNP